VKYFNQPSTQYSSLARIGRFLANDSDLVCLSHLRWDFVYQRPQHLLSRCAQSRRVFFIEEPVVEFVDAWWLDVSQRECGVWVVVPHLPDWVGDTLRATMHESLINELFEDHAIANPILWYYTPAALSFTAHLEASAVVYDCMDELSAFRGASPALQELEQSLLQRADVVFTGGQSLYEAKKHLHPNIHAFPSSIDTAHFAQARTLTDEPIDQRDIPHPRLGFYGVIDERMDLELLEGIAQAKPDWQLVMIGPVVKIDPAQLPQQPNIHYLGSKSYQELPHYLAGWDVAMLPFARNESTRFISPTKTPEYLAAGKPVVSTSIRDVVRPYGEQNLVQIADTVTDFVAAVAAVMQGRSREPNWLHQVDQFLTQNSWDQTWTNMLQHIEVVLSKQSDAAYPLMASDSHPKVNLPLPTRTPAPHRTPPSMPQTNAQTSRLGTH
jgi:UDP-galactopyranose mutase